MRTVHQPRCLSLRRIRGIRSILLFAVCHLHFALISSFTCAQSTQPASTQPVSVRGVLPQWFGAKADGQTDDSDALQRAVDFACTSRVLLVDLGAGQYRLTKTLNCTNTREPNTIRRDGLRIVGNSFVATALIGDTGDGHAIIETSGSQWLELDNFALNAGTGNPSSVGLFSGCPKACPQSQNQVYHIAISLGDAIQQNGGLGSVGIWNYAAEEHTYRSVYVHANRPVVLWAFNGEKPDAPDSKGMFSYKHSYIELLNAPHSLGMTTFSGECFLLAVGGHAPAVTSHCVNSLSMQGTYLGSVGPGQNTCAFDIYGSLVNLTYSGTIEGHANFARVNDLLTGSNVSATFGGVRQPNDPVLLLGLAGRIENCDLKFTLEEHKTRPLLGLASSAAKPTAALANTTIKTSQDVSALVVPPPLRTNSKNLTLANPQTQIAVNREVTRP